MMKAHPSYSVAECKVKAKRLLKALNSADNSEQAQAQKRFARIPQPANQIYKLKHALQIIALEKGFASWVQLKMELPMVLGGFLNEWFASYTEAKAYQQRNGGYVLPHKQQCFVVSREYISQLGFDPDAEDWQAIDFDWVKPVDKMAWQRLCKQWHSLQKD